MNNIKTYREKIDATQSDLAKHIGVNQSSFNRYERAERQINTNLAWRIVNALNSKGAKCKFQDVFPNPLGK